MHYCYLATPIGELLLAGVEDAVCLISFPEGTMRRQPDPLWEYSQEPFLAAGEQLTEYFSGKRQLFDLNMRPSGTDFQLRVLEELQRIPYGTTVSYADIAVRINKPRAVRAVGAANGRNPLPIVIPCHRVIGSNGKMTGFGGGIPTKRALLRLEQQNSQL